ncbi:ComEC/Rec2 family competence protein [Geothrix oryzisoli]|uniref:ComEC/Rec2 family competence protein n=1 Tax=Geothrix oryzisoli TaxID=2922721 RepID=UPI001FAD6756|nr:hypothetical protein [Geothrix oryzisoli]
MNIYTLNVGQGQFVVVTGETEAFIVDTYLPMNPSQDVEYVKAALTEVLRDKNLIGLMITGFDADHFNEVGLRVVLNKYRPDWLMYPKYFKNTISADRCFDVIEDFAFAKSIKRYSVCLKSNPNRFYNKISDEFKFEILSPHADDMTSSNNCSLVCKVTERSTQATYMVTGDTECDRWDSIVEYFADSLECDVLAAPHHGSKHGITEEAIALMCPVHVIVSAGVDNQFGHPSRESVRLFEEYADAWISTNEGDGQSLLTEANGLVVETSEF